MDVMLLSVKWQFAPAFQDDIVIFGKAPEKLIDYVRRVLLSVYKDMAILKLTKCNFSTYTID